MRSTVRSPDDGLPEEALNLMQLLIQAHGFSLTKALKDQVRRRFSTALRHGISNIAAVKVRLRDINGPRHGGVDKRCGVELRFARGGAVMINETDRNLYAAIDKAADRSKRTLLERLRRLRARRRSR